MLKKRHRLSRAQFMEYFRRGKRVHTPHFQVIYHPHHKFHASVVVGKKVAKKAVDRNRLRRQVYARLRHLATTQAHTGIFIVIVKPPAAALSKSALSEELAALVGQSTKKR